MSELKTFIVTYHFADDPHPPRTQRVCAPDRDTLELRIPEIFDLEVEVIDSVAEA